MPHPLEHSYNWRTATVFASLAALICIGVLARSNVPGRLWALVVVVVLWALIVGVIYLRTSAYLLVDGSRLTVQGSDGRALRVVAPVALLRGGHSALFTWILGRAPQAQLDKGSRRTAEQLKTRGLIP